MLTTLMNPTRDMGNTMQPSVTKNAFPSDDMKVMHIGNWKVEANGVAVQPRGQVSALGHEYQNDAWIHHVCCQPANAKKYQACPILGANCYTGAKPAIWANLGNCRYHTHRSRQNL